jgi:hypothetical protein
LYVGSNFARPVASHSGPSIEINLENLQPPEAELMTDFFSLQYVGRIQFPAHHDFKFRMNVDPDAKVLLKIDGVVVVDIGFLNGVTQSNDLVATAEESNFSL